MKRSLLLTILSLYLLVQVRVPLVQAEGPVINHKPAVFAVIVDTSPTDSATWNRIKSAAGQIFDILNPMTVIVY